MRRTLIASLFFIALVAFAPAPAHAELVGPLDPIIPDACKCENVQTPEGETITGAPGWGCVLQVVQNVIRLLISLGIVLAVLALVYAGFQWMTAGANAERRTKGKNLLINVFVGLAIILTAWLIVDFVMKTLAGENTGGFGPWNSILAGTGYDQCLIVREPDGLADGSIGIVFGDPTGGVDSPITGTAGCPTCTKLTGFTCKSGNSCTIDSQVKSRLDKLNSTFSGTWIVTEAYPPTAQHSNQCHAKGTCIDAAFRSPTGYTVQNIVNFAHAAAQSDLRVVFETDNCALRNAVRDAGIAAYCRTDNGYSHITGTHFSVYSH